jgi:hypothetical protein
MKNQNIYRQTVNIPAIRSLFVLFSPTWFSVISGIFIAAIYVGSASIFFGLRSGHFRKHNIYNFMSKLDAKTSLRELSQLISSLTSKPLLLTTLLMLVTFIACSVMFVIRNSNYHQLTFFRSHRYIHPNLVAPSNDFLFRVLLFSVSLTLLLLFTFVFSWQILPITLGLINRSITQGENPVYVGLAYAILLSYTHIGVILLRLTLYKNRVF